MANASNVITPAANAAAVFDLPADPANKVGISGFTWSYSGIPAGGQLTVESPVGTTIHTFFIVNGGPGVMPFTFRTPINQALRVTLAAGGAGVFGTLNVILSSNLGA